jgi:hypothetical protein
VGLLLLPGRAGRSVLDGGKAATHLGSVSLAPSAKFLSTKDHGNAAELDPTADGDCLFMTGGLLLSDRPVTDRGERVEAQPKAPRRSRLARLLIAWPYLVPLLVLSVVYGRTVQRSTGDQFSVDTMKFDYLGLVLGTAHPPGYPLYTMLNAAFVRIVPWGSVAFRANLLSAVFAILACLVAVPIFTKLGVRPVVAAGGASALGLIPHGRGQARKAD